MLDKNALTELMANAEGTGIEIVPIPFPLLDQEIDKYIEMQGQPNASEEGVYYGETFFANDRWYNKSDVIFQVWPPIKYELDRPIRSWLTLDRELPNPTTWTLVAHEIIDNKAAVILRSDDLADPILIAVSAMTQNMIGTIRRVEPA